MPAFPWTPWIAQRDQSLTANRKVTVRRAWLRALGGGELPRTFEIRGQCYRHLVTFKHDFFAATGAYEGPNGKVALKIQRQAPVFGIPMMWLGRGLAGHESRMCQLLGSIDGIPRFIGRYKSTGIVREFIEGEPLARSACVDDGFFPRLAGMLDEIHLRHAAYVDLEKTENILVGRDGRPYLFDFQISWHLPSNRFGDSWVAGQILRVLQASDSYHLLKHRRRVRPDQLSAGEMARSFRPPAWIGWHRSLFRPITKLRRMILVRLGQRGSHRTRSPG